MKKVLIALGALLALVIAALVAIPFFIPLAAVKEQAVTQVKAATGRDLKIGGDLTLSLFPSVAVKIGDVAFANAPGGSVKDMVTLKSLDLKVKLVPLFSGQVEVDSFVLVEPVILIETDKKGKGNWQMAGAAAEAKPDTAAAPPGQPAKPAADAPKPGGLADIRLGDIRLVDAKLSYLDGVTGKRQDVEKVNLKLNLPSLDKPMKAEGEATWRGKAMALTFEAGSPRALAEGGASEIKLTLGGEPLKLTFGGKVDTGGAAPKIAGDVDLAVPSIRKLADWTGNPVAFQGQGETLATLAINGRLDVAGPVVKFENAAIAIDAMRSKGEFLVDAGKAKPYLKGKLDVEKLDLNPYLPPESAATPAAGGEAKPAPAPAGAPAAKAGWSDDPLDLTGLQAADVDFALTVGGIQFRKITIGKSAVTLGMKGGKATVALTEMALYDGSGTARIELDGTSKAAGVGATVKLAKVQAEPLIRDAAGSDRLSGTLGVDATIAGKGATQRQLVQALGGKGSFAFADGAIKGINLGQMLRNVTSAFDASARETQKTDFAELGGSFTIANGIVDNKDTALKSPLLRVLAAGKVDLPQRTVAYRVEPKIAATAEGQGGKADAAGLMVPILVEGPWDNLSYKPDLAGLLKSQLANPGAALDAVKGAAGNLANPTDAVKGLLPGALGGGASAPADGTAPADAALGAVKGLFGGKK